MTGIKPRTARVVIYQGDDLARLRDLDEAAVSAEATLARVKREAKAVEGRPTTIAEARPDPAAAQRAVDATTTERDEFAAAAEDRGVAVVMHQVGRREWRRLRNAHPPRDGNPEDEALDCNVDSMPDEVLPLSICRDQGCPICKESGKPTTIEGDLDEFLDSLSSNDYYNRLFTTILALNVGSAGANPTLRLGSEKIPSSVATSS